MYEAPTSEATEAAVPAAEEAAAPATREERTQAAIDAVHRLESGEEPLESQEAAQAEETAPSSDAVEDPAAGKTKTELWATITEQNRRLRQMEAAGKAKGIADYSADELYTELFSRDTPEEEAAAPEEAEDEVPGYVGEIRKELEELKAERQRERQQADTATAYRVIDQRIAAGRDKEGNPWPFLETGRSEGSYNEVIRTFRELWEIEREEPDLDRVLNAVEQSIKERETTRRGRYDALFSDTPPDKPAARASKATESNGESKTIGSSGAGDTPTPDDKPLSRDERVKRAMALIE